MRKSNIVLHWPPACLSPNARVHWSVKSKAAKSYRKDAGWLAVTSKVKVPSEGMIHLGIRFLPPNKRKFDLDNLLARIKSGLDGVADGLGVNDNRFKLSIEIGNVYEGGCVVIDILET